MDFLHKQNNAAALIAKHHTAYHDAETGVEAGKVIDLDSPGRPQYTNMNRQPKNDTLQMQVPKRSIAPSLSMDEEERTIVKAVLQGDLSEFQILVRRYQKPVYNLMFKVTLDVMTAEDLTQETFTRVYEKLHSFKLRKRFFPWLYTIAVNLCKDHLRRQGISNGLFSDKPDDDQWPDPDGQDCARKPDCVLEVKQIGRVLDKFPIRYSEPMLLYYREGFSIREISKALGISSSATKVRIHRGRRKLMEIIGGEQ